MCTPRRERRLSGLKDEEKTSICLLCFKVQKSDRTDAKESNTNPFMYSKNFFSNYYFLEAYMKKNQGSCPQNLQCVKCHEEQQFGRLSLGTGDLRQASGGDEA